MVEESPEDRRARLDSLVERMKARDEVAAAESVPLPFAALASLETRQEPAKCAGCQGDYIASSIIADGSPLIVGTYCPLCVAKREQEAKDEAAEELRYKRELEWERVCPPDYRDTEIERIRREWINLAVAPQIKRKGAYHRTTLDELLKVEPSEGMLIFGVTGRCKTRFMFELCKRFHFEGRRVAYVNGATFADKLAASYGQSAAVAEQFIERHIQAPICFYDDLGKEPLRADRKMSERAEEALYRILEERKAHRRPFHGTTNLPHRQAFLDRVSEDRGAPMMRRLEQMAAFVTL